MKVQAWFDGSVAPVNPGGTASYGIVVKADGQIVHTASAVVGSGPAMSNNVAEYAGLNAVLEYLIAEGVEGDVEIFGDSAIVINSLKKGKPSKGLCGPFSQRALELRQLLTCNPTFAWIPREQNAEADALSRTS